MLSLSVILFFVFPRHVANGEILGVTLLMEDALQSGYEDPSSLTDVDDLESKTSKKDGAGSRGTSRTGSRATSRQDVHKDPLEGVVAKVGQFPKRCG